MNWMDLLLIVAMGVAAAKGYQRGFVVELASLVGVVLGIWVAARYSEPLMTRLGLEMAGHWAFLLTFLMVLVVVHLLAHALTTLMDVAQLGLPNKLAGILFGALRSAFVLSVVLNLLGGFSSEAMPGAEARKDSRLYGPVRAFAPLVLPVLGDTKWVKAAAERFQQDLEALGQGSGEAFQ